MYTDFYGFTEKPFTVTPDTKYFFPSEKHEEALNNLYFAIVERKGFAVVTGEIGCGKTTVWHALLNKLPQNTKIGVITNTYLTPRQMLIAILEEFEISFKESWPKIKLLSHLNRFLIKQIAEDYNVVLIIDEAQNLNAQVLEEVRMLSNLETEKEKLLQIILMGQPELREILSLHELRQLRQRIGVYFHILPMSKEETFRYIQYRLSRAGCNRTVIFDETSMVKIYEYTQGVPRAINTLCDRALLTGYVQERKVIQEDIVEEVFQEMNEIYSLNSM